MSEQPKTDSYQFCHQMGVVRLELGVHAPKPIHKPRIRWSVENTDLSGKGATIRVPPDRSDFWKPYASLDVAEPRLVFGRDENPRPGIKPESRTIDAEERDTIQLPAQLASDLRDQLEGLGTVAENEKVCSDPSDFPSVIREAGNDPTSGEWESVGWEPARKVMWYAHRGDYSGERSYQIADGKLIWRRFDQKTPETVTKESDNRENKAEAGN